MVSSLCLPWLSQDAQGRGTRRCILGASLLLQVRSLCRHICACQLAQYCRNREPEFFKDTLFVVDEMHSNGHSSCSQACFLSNYMQTDPELLKVNSSAAECSNGGLNRIRKSISYMSESHAILYAHTFLSVWNRNRERGFKKDKGLQDRKFEASYDVQEQI